MKNGSVTPKVIGSRPSGQRPVGDREQQVVLPEAEADRDDEHARGDDDPRAQLVEVLDDAELVVVAGLASPVSRTHCLRAVGDDLALDGSGVSLSAR